MNIGVEKAGTVPHVRDGEFYKIPLGTNFHMGKYLGIEGPEMGI